MTVMVPDTEFAVKTWLKTDATLNALLAGRVFFGFPDGSPALPLIMVSQVSGLSDNTVAGIDAPRLSFQCWGQTKKAASDVRRALVAALQGLQSTDLDSATHCYYAADIATLWLPGDDAPLARYVVDATLYVRAA